MKINVELDMATLGFEQDPETGDLYPTDDLMAKVADILASRVTHKSDIRGIAESEIRNVARSAAQGLIAEVLAGPIQRTDGYGNARGQVTTVREMVLAEVERWMTLPKSDSWSRDQSMASSLEKIVDEILRKELKPTIDAAKKKVSEEVLRLAVDGAAKALASARVL